MKYIIITIVVFVLLVALAGIYKFNFTDDAIYIKNEKGEVFPLNQIENKD